MSAPDAPSWTAPEYVATVVGVLATGALFFYSGLTADAPSTGTVGFVLLWVLVPVTVAYEVTRRVR